MAKNETGIQYIRMDAPAPPPSGAHPGTRYAAEVPATLDLADRAALTINGMTGPTDPDLDYRVYWQVSFRHNPAVMYHEFADLAIQAKFMEGVPLMRTMCGSDQGEEAEQAWKQVLLWMIAPGGLLASPMQPYAWLRRSLREVALTGFSGYRETDQLVETQVNGLMLGPVATFADLDDKAFWEPIGRAMVDGMGSLTVADGDTAYFPGTYFMVGETADPAQPPPARMEAAVATWPASRLTHFYRVTGYEPALELSGKICHYLADRSDYFGPDLEWNSDNADPEHPRYHVVHSHHHSMSLRTCLEYGLVAGDQQLVEFGHKGFDVSKTYMECLSGFFPRDLNPAEPDDSEICGVADMVRLAVLLAEADMGDAYWDDVDRWVRNNLAEGQFTRYDWVERLHLGQPPTAPFEGMCTDRVCERNVGSFGGWQAPNEFVEFKQASAAEELDDERGPAHGIMHCCTGNGARALYDAWRSIVSVQGDKVRVNLLLNCAHKSVDVHSHIPYAGQVDIHVKQECRLSVRMPGWVDLKAVQGAVDGAALSVTFDGRYAQIGQVAPGQIVSLSFPIVEQTDRVTMANRYYFLVRKGHDVVAIDPPGKLCPLYRRDHYRDNTTLWKKTSRFVADQIVDS